MYKLISQDGNLSGEFSLVKVDGSEVLGFKDGEWFKLGRYYRLDGSIDSGKVTEVYEDIITGGINYNYNHGHFVKFTYYKLPKGEDIKISKSE